MSQADREVARTIKAFRQFVFECPKTRAEKLWKQSNLLLFGGLGTIVLCTLIIVIFMGRR